VFVVKSSRVGLAAGLVSVVLLLPVVAAANPLGAGKPLSIGERVLRANEFPGFSSSATPKVVASVAVWEQGCSFRPA